MNALDTKPCPAATLLLAALLAPHAAAQDAAPPRLTPAEVLALEAEHWTVEHFTTPDGAVLEVGGMDWLPDGRLALSTRRGQVWLVDDALADDPDDARFTLFAEGLQEGMGLNVVQVAPPGDPDGTPPDGRFVGPDGSRHALYVLQRGELTELRDVDGDGRAETWLTVTDDWGLSGHYHEFAFGLPEDADGKLYIGLNVSFPSPEWWLGRSMAPYRGWVLRIDPATGVVTPVAHGFRSPAGLTIDPHGRLLVTDNQGDWLGSGPLHHVEPGAFHGHPASLRWTADYLANEVLPSTMLPPDEERTHPALWIPYAWSRSAGDLAAIPEDGSFGPFPDQLALAELTNGHVFRVQLEDVDGTTQGAVWPLRQKVGSAYRTLFAPDGSLFIGMTNRGWGGLAPDHGLLRIRPTGVPPMEMASARLTGDPTGFALRFTEPLADDLQLTPAHVTVVQYDYDYWWEYGSPERHMTEVPVAAVALSTDRRELALHVPDLRAGMAARVTLAGVRGASGRPLLHDTFSYTVNRLVDGGPPVDHVSKVVPPPPPKQGGKEGVLRLTYLDATDAWDGPGWQLCDAVLAADDRSRFDVTPGVNALVNRGAGEAGDFVSRWAFGSGRYHVEFMLPEGGASAVYVQGRYGVELTDDTYGLRDGSLGTGAILPSGDGSRGGLAPTGATYGGAGTWHALDIAFVAPVVDDGGALVEPARFLEVRLDDVVIQEDVVFDGPSAGGRDGAAPLGPLVIVGDAGPVALRTLEFTPDRAREHRGVDLRADGWTPVLTDLAGWSRVPPSDAPPGSPDFDEDDFGWEFVDGTVEGFGPRSHLLSPRGDYGDVELFAQVQVNEGGDGGLLLRASADGDEVVGYEVQLDASSGDPLKTGSVRGLAPVKVSAIPPGTWVDLHAIVRDTPEGARVTVSLNGVVVADAVDAERRHGRGHVALQAHHDGSLVRYRDVRVRVLD